MTNRILLTPEGVRISRKGVDVLNPPALTEEYLIIDPSWPKIERLHHLAHVSGDSVSSGFTVFFPPISPAPLAFVVTRIKNTNVYRDELAYYSGTYHINNIGYPHVSSNIQYYTQTDRLVLSFVNGTPSGNANAFDYTVLVMKNG